MTVAAVKIKSHFCITLGGFTLQLLEQMAPTQRPVQTKPMFVQFGSSLHSCLFLPRGLQVLIDNFSAAFFFFPSASIPKFVHFTADLSLTSCLSPGYFSSAQKLLQRRKAVLTRQCWPCLLGQKGLPSLGSVQVEHRQHQASLGPFTRKAEALSNCRSALASSYWPLGQREAKDDDVFPPKDSAVTRLHLVLQPATRTATLGGGKRTGESHPLLLCSFQPGCIPV